MKKIIEFLRSIEQPNAHISTKDPRLQADFYRYNLFFCMNAGIVISILSLIGMIGTSASLSSQIQEKNSHRQIVMLPTLHLTLS